MVIIAAVTSINEKDGKKEKAGGESPTLPALHPYESYLAQRRKRGKNENLAQIEITKAAKEGVENLYLERKDSEVSTFSKRKGEENKVCGFPPRGISVVNGRKKKGPQRGRRGVLPTGHREKKGKLPTFEPGGKKEWGDDPQ